MKKKLYLCLSLFVLLAVSIACGLPGKAATPVAATATPTLPPDWKKFSGKGVELWLPGSFEGGNLTTDLDLIVSKLKALGPDFEQQAQTIEKDPDIYALWAFDTHLSPSASFTSASVASEKSAAYMTLDVYIALAKKNLPEAFKVTDKTNLTIDEKIAARLLLSADINNIDLREALYIIKGNGVMWNIVYASRADEFDALLPLFDQSAQTFHLTE